MVAGPRRGMRLKVITMAVMPTHVVVAGAAGVADGGVERPTVLPVHRMGQMIR